MNPLYNQMQNNTFIQFMNSMRGKDPNAIINKMVADGRLSQAQLNMVQNKANEMKASFDGLRSMFGF